VDLALMDELELMSSVSRQVRVPPTSPTIQGSVILTGEMPVVSQDGQGAIGSQASCLPTCHRPDEILLCRRPPGQAQGLLPYHVCRCRSLFLGSRPKPGTHGPLYPHVLGGSRPSGQTRSVALGPGARRTQYCSRELVPGAFLRNGRCSRGTRRDCVDPFLGRAI
jgi:hypothetical protein